MYDFRIYGGSFCAFPMYGFRTPSSIATISRRSIEFQAQSFVACFEDSVPGDRLSSRKHEALR
jgi:hypothetical protein